MFRYVEYVGPWAQLAHGAETLSKIADQLLDAAASPRGKRKK